LLGILKTSKYLSFKMESMAQVFSYKMWKRRTELAFKFWKTGFGGIARTKRALEAKEIRLIKKLKLAAWRRAWAWAKEIQVRMILAARHYDR
jgi:hypothetical protein